MSHLDGFIITDPKPYQTVGGHFVISGSVPIKLLGETSGFTHSIIYDFLEVHGRTIMGSSVDINLPTRTGDPEQIINFSFTFHDLNYLTNGWIIQSQGRMAIRLSLNGGNHDIEQNEVFLPIIFSIPEPLEGFSKELIDKHETIEKRVKQYRVDSNKYIQELGLITKRRADFFEKSKEYNSDLSRELTDELAEELSYVMDSIGGDTEIQALEEKYKESLEWSGPLLHGTIGWMNGFSFRVYSNDHGKHFHVIHKEKEINARFSFPQIKLIDYKGKSSELNKKVIKLIQEYFTEPKNFRKLEQELAKQVSS